MAPLLGNYPNKQLSELGYFVPLFYLRLHLLGPYINSRYNTRTRHLNPRLSKTNNRVASLEALIT